MSKDIINTNTSICTFILKHSFDRAVAGQGSIDIEFSSSSNEGALLVLPEGADQHDLCNLQPFERNALRYAKSWYKFARTKLGRTRISANSLYLITGCHKTSSWSLAAYFRVWLLLGPFNFQMQWGRVLMMCSKDY